MLHSSMKALLLTEYEKLEVTDFPVPEVAPDEVLIKVGACGICGSDIHGYDGSSGRRIPPLVMGHEAAGTIEKVGQSVSRFSVGDRVTFDSTVYCGDCDYCRADQVNLCENRMVLGVSCDDYRRHGAFAEYIAVPERILYALPDSLSFEHAAMIEPVSIAVHAIDRAGITAGQSVAVIGAGMIGLFVIQVLRHRGCSPIIAIDLSDDRLEVAKSLGATHTLNPSNDDALAEIQSLTEGEGVHATFEAVGATPTVTLAIEAARKGGAVTLIGNLAPKVEVPLQSIVTRELTLYGSCASNGDYPECIDLLASGAVDPAPMISHTAPLSDGADWFAKLYAGDPATMKVLLKP